jgi:hypothetical protein
MAFPPSPDLIDNLTTRLTTVEVAGQSLPMTITNGGTPTCYICCPSEAYIAYAQAELRHFTAHPVLKTLLSGLIAAARPLVHLSGLDQQVQPNNALVSTNILPDMTAEGLRKVTQTLIKAYPQHVIVWRSLGDHDPALKTAFASAGYKALPMRRVYIFAGQASKSRSRDLTRDLALLAQADYQRLGPNDFTPDDFERVAELYARLYLEKYTPLNPAYSAAFFREAYRTGFLEFHGLRTPEGRLDGVIGFYIRGRTLTAPVVGYDTALPARLGLYRRLMAIGFEKAHAGSYLYNMSAGAGQFKRNRGAVGSFEYLMVYDRHLSAPRRAAISAMARILEYAKPVLLKADL